MSIDEERLALDREKFDCDRAASVQERLLRERDFKEQRKTRIWSQIATFVPILAIVLGFWVNVVLESRKQANANATLARKLKREFIDRQLTELYYPIKLRLEKDNAVWTLSFALKGQQETAAQQQFSTYIERQILIPNHDEIIKILDSKFALLKNGDEKLSPADQASLMAAITHYERHVATYKALRSTTVPLNPIGVCLIDCDFPKDFPKEIEKRIASLEGQRASLMSQLDPR